MTTLASKRTYTERKEEIQNKIEKLKAIEKRLAAQEKAEKKKKEKAAFEKEYVASEDRRKRTHRLCQIGGAVESVLGDSYQDGDIEKLTAFLRDHKEIFEKEGEQTAKSKEKESAEEAPQIKKKAKTHSKKAAKNEIQAIAFEHQKEKEQ